MKLAWEKITTLEFIRLFAVISVSAILGLIFLVSFLEYKIADPIPSLSIISRDKQKELGPFSARVKTGLYVKNFSKFDVINNDFVMDAVVWFEFSPSEVRLDNIEKFSFLDGEITYKSDPDIRLIEDRTFVKYDVSVKLLSDLRFHYYPFSSHRLPIMLTNKYVTTTEMTLMTEDSSFVISPAVKLSNWTIHDTTTDYGYRIERFDQVDEKKQASYPQALFLVEFFILGVKNALIIFIPIIFAMLLSMFSLLVPYRFEENNLIVLTLSTASISSLLMYRFVINVMMPSVGYMTTTDLVYTFAIGVTFVIFCFHIIGTILSRLRFLKTQAEKRVLFERYNMISIALFNILSLGSVAFLYYVLLLWQ